MGSLTCDTLAYRGGRVDIDYDEAPGVNPRDDESNLSRLVLAPSSRYVMPNEIGFRFGDWDCVDTDETFDAWCERTLREEYGALYVVSVYRFEHSGVAYNVGGFADPWDSGQVGYAIVTAESAAEIGTRPEDFAEVVAAEVVRYGEWCNGEVYGWIAYDPDGNEIESCFGYIGDEEHAYMFSEGKHAIDWFLLQREEMCERIAADAMTALVAHIG